ncbi:MAG: patatin family protein [Prevotella sp.]|nr:patatin family protein [Prevotella sp.]
MRKGLVLEGGALRGLFSAGVMDVMMEKGITFDGIIGVSAGAAFGCNYKSGQIGRAIRYNMRFARDKKYCSVQSFLKTGDLFGAEYAYHIVPEQYDKFDNEAFEQNPTEFYVVCTDVVNGIPIYKKCTRGGHQTYDWIRASASMPVVSHVVELEGYQLLDGGMTDSIPLAYFQQIGFDRNIVILTQPAGYQKTPNPLMPLIRVGLRHYPKTVEAMRNRPEMYNSQLAYLEQEEQKGNTLVIRPQEKLPIGHISHDPEEMKRVYDIGREMGKQRIQEIRDFLIENG